MTKKIVYIHGFATAGEGLKVDLIRKQVDCEVISPTLEFNPEKTIVELEKIIDKDTVLVGTSLGGFYAWYMAYKHNLKAILINPSPTPNHSMNERLNGAKMVMFNNLITNEPFPITKEHSDYLAKMTQETLTRQIKFPNDKDRYITMFLAKDDTVLNHFMSIELIDVNDIFITENGEHSYFKNWDYVITGIKKML